MVRVDGPFEPDRVGTYKKSVIEFVIKPIVFLQRGKLPLIYLSY
jgi:hypothetical protein